jgi:2'-5' RNA ligase
LRSFEVSKLRLFVAIDIEESIRARLAEFIEQVRGYAPHARWQKPESLHVTLKFLGETADDRAARVRELLAQVRHPAVTIRFAGTGFFPTTRAARVFWAGVEGGELLAELARKIDDAMAQAGFEREQRAFHPHLTLARSSARASGNPHQPPHGGGSPFRKLAETLAGAPADFGTMTAHEFYLYLSKLGPKGAQYTKIAGFPLP